MKNILYLVFFYLVKYANTFKTYFYIYKNCNINKKYSFTLNTKTNKYNGMDMRNNYIFINNKTQYSEILEHNESSIDYGLLYKIRVYIKKKI